MRKPEHYRSVKKLMEAESRYKYMLDVFGDTIAEREGYKNLYGMDAVHFYLIHKFHWLPSVVRSMSADDLRLVLAEEMSDWTAPEEACE